MKIRRRLKPERNISIIDYLPEDVLCQIFSHFDLVDLKSMSLVCKLFCSLSSSLAHKLTLKDSSLTYSDFQRLFKRFSCVKKIVTRNISIQDTALLAICKSDLNLEKLQLLQLQNPEAPTIENMSMSRVIKGIKSLQLGWFDGTATKLQVVEFINLFRSLTELDIFGRQWTDKLIYKVTLKLPNLRKISLAFNDVATDKTLVILSTNCPKLESVDFCWCKKFTPEALSTFFCNNPQLSSLVMPDFESLTIYEVSKVVQGIRALKSLNHLSLDSNHLEDALLIGIAESRPPLKSLIIDKTFSRKYTMVGLSCLLSACTSLESLDIHLPYRKSTICKADDGVMSTAVKKLPNLKHITLWLRIVCQATLFSLVENCPLLETIHIMSNINPRKVHFDQGMVRPTKKNYSIKLIVIKPKDLEIQFWPMLKSYCPNLKEK
ncbi:hypothetical protein QQ045_019375 [Rhodiola kirilowii]